MSKLFLLISLMGFISIEAFAGNTPPKKTNNSTPGYGFPSSNISPFGPKPANVKIPCQANHPDCLDPKAQQRKTSSAPLSGEDKVKDNCYKKSGNTYGDAYQKCLSDNGIFHVNRNINSSDSSQSDSRLCYVGDPLCDRCLAESKGASSNSARRNQVANCIAEAKKPKPTPKPKEEPSNEIVVTATCTKADPRKCTNKENCEAVYGKWDGRACAIQPCQVGSTVDSNGPGNTCKCDGYPGVSIERGTDQVCPGRCGEEDRKVYNDSTHMCVCQEGYEDRAGIGVCVAKVAAASSTAVAECIKELQDKVTSCGNAASNAVNKCDADKKTTGSGDDTISVMQSLLKGATGVMAAGGAADNCSSAAIAGSTGYYALDELRDKCDGEINTCKTSCSDSTTYINANKDRVYQACRFKDWDYYGCRADTPYPDATLEADFNARWDADHKAEFDQKIQQMLSNVSTSVARCQSGTADSENAVAKRDKMSGYMDEANNAVRAANQCQCQLAAGGGDCSKAPGPADCAANPTLEGCAQATVNCNSATDTSPKCACFRNPNSNECKNIANTLKTGTSNISAFAGATPSAKQSSMTGFGGETTGGSGGSGGSDVAGDLSGLNSTEVSAAGGSDTSTTDNGSPFAAAGGSGVGGGGGQGAGDGSSASSKTEDGPESKTFRGLFETAKNALGSLFKDKKSDKSTYTGADGIVRDADGNPIGVANKWRPRGMVRGLAGNDTEIAGKFEDIWKVMNKQYKVQDQKDSFIFGEKN